MAVLLAALSAKQFAVARLSESEEESIVRYGNDFKTRHGNGYIGKLLVWHIDGIDIAADFEDGKCTAITYLKKGGFTSAQEKALANQNLRKGDEFDYSHYDASRDTSSAKSKRDKVFALFRHKEGMIVIMTKEKATEVFKAYNQETKKVKNL